MIVKFTQRSQIGSTVYAAGSEADIDNGTADQVVRNGWAVRIGAGVRSIEAAFSFNSIGSATGVIGPAGDIVSSRSHPYYHFHGFAGNQVAGDGKFFDLSGLNHGVRGANLSDATAFTTAGYIATANPGVGAEDAGIHLPSLNFDYAGGEKLIVWWLMSGAVEAANAIVMGDGWSTTAGQRGVRVRQLFADGKFDLTLWGATQGSSGSSHAAVFDGTPHSLAFCFDGSAANHGMWADEVYHTSFGSSYSSFGSGAAFDTLSANTWNVGGSRPASAASSAVGDGAAVKTRALVIIRLPATYAMPSVATLTSAFQQLRANPGQLLQATAF